MSKTLKAHIKEIVTLTEEEYMDIVSHFEVLTFRKHQFVLQERQKVSAMYFVESGLLKSSFIDDAGKEYILQFATDQWWISDFDAFYSQGNAKITIDCIENSKLLALSYTNLEELCKRYPKLEHFFRIKSNFGYVALQQRIISLLSESAKERFETFCKQYPAIVNKIPKQLVANYIGVSRETLSRLKK